MQFRKSTTAISMGVVLLFFGVAFAQSPPQFQPPVNLGPKINSSFYESDPFWDGPRKRLYFVKAGPMTVNQSEDIWFAEWTDTGWTDPKAIGGGINTIEIEHSPSVTPDGQKLFYVGFARSGWPFAWDVWMSLWDSSQNDWGSPVNLDCPVSTPGVEFSAKIAPDGKSLYFFTSQGTCDSIGPSVSGLVLSVWDSTTGWSMPQSLGSNVNGGGGELYPSVIQNGQWLYFRRLVSDGASIFVSPWTGSDWGPAFDLRSQIGERAGAPSVVPSGDSLFFSTPALSGFGNSDIFMMEAVPTGIDEKKPQNLPITFELFQNYPNPFNSGTRISFLIPSKSEDSFSLAIFNLLGQSVRTLAKEGVVAGENEVAWDGKDENGQPLPTGVYFYSLQIGDTRQTKKMVLVK